MPIGITATQTSESQAGRRYLAISINNAVYTVNAFRPTTFPPLFAQSFFASWLTIELAWLHLIWQVVLAGINLVRGGARTREGKLALVITAGNIAGLVVSVRQSLRSRDEVKKALETLGTTRPAPKRLPTKRTRDVLYAEVGGARLKLDTTGPADPATDGTRRPALIQVHGGGWVIGDKREQGLPLIRRLASEGWVCFNINYRLSPRAAFPAHVEDVKRAIAWVREHADDYGIDPDFIAITGGSAGGHLSALAALTPNDPRLQKGFEDVDTSVQAAVPFYGIYDFTDRYGHWHPGTIERFIAPTVMKRRLADEPDWFALASPMDQIGPHAPPFLVIHGDKDTLAPVRDARLFARDLAEVSHEPTIYLELAGAQHAFDVFPSIRCAAVIDGVAHFLHDMHARHLTQKAELVRTGREPLGA